MPSMMPGSSPAPTAETSPTSAATCQAVLLVVAPDEVLRYPCGTVSTVAAHTTVDAMRALDGVRPHVA